MARLVIDPITRIEGHLRAEVNILNGKVANAWTSSTLFRGIEVILKGRDPRDAWLFTQRACGVCTYIHGLNSVRAVENALGITVPDNARIIRNLLNGVQMIHDHIIHFYHLHLLDWVDVVSALRADPAKTALLASQISPSAQAIDMTAVKNRLQKFVDSGQLGPFASGYWGHPEYKLSPEANLLLMAHYIEALRQQVRTARMHAIFGGKNPHPQSLVVGGVTCTGDLTTARIGEFRSLWQETKSFVETMYIPDVYLLAGAYKEWFQYGKGKNFLAFGEFQLPGDGLYFPSGAIFRQVLNQVDPLDVAGIAEHVSRSWYQGTTPLHPSQGETVPSYTGMNTAGKYSWIKAPRYLYEPMEVGPLARVLVAYGAGHAAIRDAVNDFLAGMGIGLGKMSSVMGRTAARALETRVIADAMGPWMDELEQNIASGNRAIMQPYTMKTSATGFALHEAPRGALGHWVSIADGKISNYQMVVPSTWNFSPRDDQGKLGPVEKTLINIPVADPQRPLEVLRTIHSFDPCIACSVHTVDLTSKDEQTVRFL